jgi:hypothetical protein
MMHAFLNCVSGVAVYEENSRWFMLKLAHESEVCAINEKQIPYLLGERQHVRAADFKQRSELLICVWNITNKKH